MGSRWWHNYLDFPPPANAVMALPAGKSVTVQLAGNSAFTDIGQKGANVEWPGGMHVIDILCTLC